MSFVRKTKNIPDAVFSGGIAALGRGFCAKAPFLKRWGSGLPREAKLPVLMNFPKECAQGMVDTTATCPKGGDAAKLHKFHLN